MTDSNIPVPDGFERHFRQSPVTDPWEPIYFRHDGEVFSLGLRIDTPHCNTRSFLHGGVISALADNALGLCCVLQLEGVSALTVNLAIDFLAVGKKGQWLEVRAKPTKLGGTLAFSEAQIYAADILVGRANATFRIIGRS